MPLTENGLGPVNTDSHANFAKYKSAHDMAHKKKKTRVPPARTLISFIRYPIVSPNAAYHRPDIGRRKPAGKRSGAWAGSATIPLSSLAVSLAKERDFMPKILGNT